MWCNVSFAEWINFTPNDPTGMHTYFDTTSIKTSNGYTQVVTMTDSPTPGPDGILSFKVSYNFDCSSFTAKIMKAESLQKIWVKEREHLENCLKDGLILTQIL